MEEKNIAHRDIKPQNIIKHGNDYIISDLGCAFKSRDRTSYEITGTPNYLSPILRHAYTSYHQGIIVSNFNQNPFKSDVFSLGLTFLYMASLQTIGELGIVDKNAYCAKLQSRLNSLSYSETVKHVLGNMLEYEESKRCSFREISSFFQIDKIYDTMDNINLKKNKPRDLGPEIVSMTQCNPPPSKIPLNQISMIPNQSPSRVSAQSNTYLTQIPPQNIVPSGLSNSNSRGGVFSNPASSSNQPNNKIPLPGSINPQFVDPNMYKNSYIPQPHVVEHNQSHPYKTQIINYNGVNNNLINEMQKHTDNIGSQHLCYNPGQTKQLH